jgi:4-hydroxybenzoate polyprenyltransferase
MRPQHWAKNLLVFVPLLTAHEYENLQSIFAAAVAFASFSLCASAGYFINDLRDLESDRVHTIKRHRPFASGALPISWGVAGAIGLPVLSLLLAAGFLPLAFIGVLALYFVLTVAYSFYLKRVFTADVLTLSVLYMLRVLAGAVAIEVVLSSWLLAFCIFLFISLAYLKRYIELRKLNDGDVEVQGRGYFSDDDAAIFGLGVANATASIVVLALFINFPDASNEYASRNLLWALCLIMIFWTNRIWISARRGLVDEDPVDFALRDRASQLAAILSIAVVLVARYIELPF